MAQFRHIDEAPNFGEAHWGVRGLDQRVLVDTPELMLVYVRIPPGTDFPVHTHRNAQIGFQISGHAEITTSADTRQLGPDSAYYFAPNEPHGTRVVGDTPVEQIDVFLPPREEYRSAAGQQTTAEGDGA